jgi:peroxin-14
MESKTGLVASESHMIYGKFGGGVRNELHLGVWLKSLVIRTSAMASPDRQELVRNAVAFLADPNVSGTRSMQHDSTFKGQFQSQSSSLAQRIQFLEAKGLTAPEIEDALKQAGSHQATQSYRQPYQTPYVPPYSSSSYVGIAPSNQWDWRDYFVSFATGRDVSLTPFQITAILTGTVAFGAVSLFQVCSWS